MQNCALLLNIQCVYSHKNPLIQKAFYVVNMLCIVNVVFPMVTESISSIMFYHE